jgi:hypothetical protein
MNKHIFLDNLTANIGSLVAGKKKFFANNVDSPSFKEHLDAMVAEIPAIEKEAVYEVSVKSLVGDLDAAFKVAQWKGENYPYIIYHHGNNERPFDFKKTAKNTFFNIFIKTEKKIDANLIVVRAPFHNSSLKDYQNKLCDLGNFTAMLSASVFLNEKIIQQIRKSSNAPILSSGISLGGWVTNLHRAFYNSSTAYAPLLAGSFLAELFIRSKYKKMASEKAKHNSEILRKILNFDNVFQSVSDKNLFPLLAKYDQFIEFEVQKETYNSYPLKTIERGHVTGAISAMELSNHILKVIDKIK